MGSEMEELIRDFVVEAQEILDSLDEKFVQLEQSPDDKELINDIFRAVHTIKGASGFLGFQNLVSLSHSLENLLKKIRDDEMKITPERVDIILEATNLLKELIAQVSSTGKDDKDVTAMVEKLKAELENPDRVQDTKEEEPVKPKKNTDQEASEAPHQPQVQETTIRVDIDKLDSVFNLVGEVVLGRNRLQRIVERITVNDETNQELQQLAEAMEALSSVISELQSAVMKTRMQPVRKIFNKFPTMIRNIARSRGKDVNLHISGEQTEVDKSVIEHLADPLIHLLRNAIDHGIEPKEERLKTGKPPEGNIYLRAFQEGNNIVIEVEDDGQGIDTDKVLKKAIEKGIITETEAQRLSEEDAIEFIFYPGFSTVDKATDLSGRGVGMDVVKENLTKINGSIKIHTQRGRGTVFSISLPLTLAIINVLLVRISQEVYGIPLINVSEVLKIKKDAIKRVDNQDVVSIRDSVIPIVRLSEVLDVPGANGLNDEFYLIVVLSRQDVFGIVVDAIEGQEEVVLKSVEGEIVSFKDESFIAGATIVGDGRVVLIIDTSMLYDSLKKGVF
ncbi:MAG: chemotaxis protein CheA [Nitrospirae bacterium]|nr:MAG: chemotaxis protein CheA [Nitrospirota bacterium]